MRKINIFVYGTLRPGQYNDREFSALAREILQGTTRGRMHNVHGDTPVFPIVDFNAEGTIVGDLLVDMPERHPQVRSVHRMEIGAGYEMREIVVNCDGTDYNAIAYHHEIEPRYHGTYIPSGDWIEWQKSRGQVWQDDDDLWDDDAELVDE